MIRLKGIYFVGLLTVIAVAAGRRQMDDSTPEATVKSFLTAINSRDAGGAQSLILAKKLPPVDRANTELKGFEGTYDLKSSKVFGEGDDVVVTAVIHVAGPSETTYDDVFRMQKVDGHWKIVPVNFAHMKVPPPSLLASLIGSDMTEQRQAATSTVCLSNMKQLSLGNIMYANDYDDRMPISDNWKSDVYPYVKSKDLFHCPDDKRPEAVSYRMSGYLSKVTMTSEVDPASLVMLYEGDKGELDARHTGRGSVGFGDGHAKLITPDQFAAGFHKASAGSGSN